VIGDEPASFGVLIVAKAPVPGHVKTRLCPPLSLAQAADIAAAALLDTLATATSAVSGDVARITVAIEGHVSEGARSGDVSQALRGCRIIKQRGDTFGERLTHAHLDSAQHQSGVPQLQIGMDTPHITRAAMIEAASRLTECGTDAVLGHAEDGGWWLLGLKNSQHAELLRRIPMSTPSTGECTELALASMGLVVRHAEPMRDVDKWDDAVVVAQLCPSSLFGRAVRLMSK